MHLLIRPYIIYAGKNWLGDETFTSSVWFDLNLPFNGYAIKPSPVHEFFTTFKKKRERELTCVCVYVDALNSIEKERKLFGYVDM